MEQLAIARKMKTKQKRGKSVELLKIILLGITLAIVPRVFFLLFAIIVLILGCNVDCSGAVEEISGSEETEKKLFRVGQQWNRPGMSQPRECKKAK